MKVAENPLSINELDPKFGVETPRIGGWKKIREIKYFYEISPLMASSGCKWKSLHSFSESVELRVEKRFNSQVFRMTPIR